MGIAGRIKDAARALLGDGGPAAPGAISAARVAPTDPDWNPSELGINALSDQYRATIVRRSRDLALSNGLIDSAIQLSVRNIVRTGIHPHPTTPWPSLNARIKEIYWRVCDAVDVSRKRSIVEMQQLHVRENFEGGESLVYRPIVAARRGYARGPAIEILPTERLPMEDWPGVHMLPAGIGNGANDPVLAPGHRLRHGVEFDADGGEVAYWIYRDHPTDGGIMNFAATRSLMRIPVERAMLVNVVRRAGQIRGLPWCTTAIPVVKLEAGFSEAAIKTAFNATALMLQIQGGNPEWARKGLAVDADGRPIRRLTPGGVMYTGEQREAKIISPNIPGPMYPQAVAVQQRRAAAAMGLSHANLSRDWSGSNYAAQRAEAVGDRSAERVLQDWVWRTLSRDWYQEDVVAWSILTGAIDLAVVGLERDPATGLTASEAFADPVQRWRLYECTVMASSGEWVDPGREAAADEIAIRSGMKSPMEVAASRGRHIEDVIEERVAAEKFWIEAREAAGLEPAPAPWTVAPGAAAPASDGEDANAQNDGQDDGQDAPPEQNPQDGESAAAPRGSIAARLGRFRAILHGGNP